MARRPRGFGLSGECQRKIDAKYDLDVEKDATNWIEAVLGEPVFGGEHGKDNTKQVLEDGKILCRLANKLGGNITISDKNVAFKKMENIEKFLTFCQIELQIPKLDLFQTVDLYEKQNMAQVQLAILYLKSHLLLSVCATQRCISTHYSLEIISRDGSEYLVNIPRDEVEVIRTIVAVGSRCQDLGIDVPVLGPKRATPNPRSFSEDQLKEGKNVIGLQMGTNKLASQAGDHFGRPRQVAGHDAYA